MPSDADYLSRRNADRQGAAGLSRQHPRRPAVSRQMRREESEPSRGDVVQRGKAMADDQNVL